MIYTIDGTITYHSEDCTLHHLPTQEALSLSISAGRLFEQLLDSNGEILTRDALLTEVWDKYGLRGSNNNLNQYLSIVRRALASFGCENFIITVPKTGIRINTDIPLTREERVHAALPPTPTTNTAEADLLAPSVTSSSSFNALLVFATVLICLLAGSAWYYLVIQAGKEEISPVTLTLSGGCQAVFVRGMASHDRPEQEKQILQILHENHQTCDSSQRLYFYKNTAFSTQSYGRTLISSCKLGDNEGVISCDNFYYLDWRMN